MAFLHQAPLPVRYKGVVLSCGCVAGIIVDEQVILERKAVERVLPLHEAQLLT
jgi:GxxExxY protein